MPTAELCKTCGLPMSVNPHPQAGDPSSVAQVGFKTECIPCLVADRHAKRVIAIAAEREVARLTRWIADNKLKFK